jgi:hypothetical protein
MDFKKLSEEDIKLIAIELHNLQKRAEEMGKPKTFKSKSTKKSSPSNVYDVTNKAYAGMLSGDISQITVFAEKGTGDIYVVPAINTYARSLEQWEETLVLIKEVNNHISSLDKEALKKLLDP